jgi:hypothetical protein
VDVFAGVDRHVYDMASRVINTNTNDETRANILEARSEIVFGSQSWTVDGTVQIINEDGTVEKLPEFDALFPNWDLDEISKHVSDLSLMDMSISESTPNMSLFSQNPHESLALNIEVPRYTAGTTARNFTQVTTRSRSSTNIAITPTLRPLLPWVFPETINYGLQTMAGANVAWVTNRNPRFRITLSVTNMPDTRLNVRCSTHDSNSFWADFFVEAL